MAHFAEINDQSIVQRVIVVANEVLLDENGVEQEALGAAFCTDLLGGTWKQTSYNGTIRKNFAASGFSYDTSRDAFLPPRPFASWTLDEENCHWQAPVAHPSDDNEYEWDEVNQAWSLTK
jgi:hypothetical protein